MTKNIDKLSAESFEDLNKKIELFAPKNHFYVVGAIGVIAIILGIINLFI